MSNIVADHPALEARESSARVTGIDPIEITFGRTDSDDMTSHCAVSVKQSGDLFLAARAIGEHHTRPAGAMLVVLDVDGWFDRLVVGTTVDAPNMLDVLRQSREAIDAAIDGLERVRQAAGA